MSTPTSDMGSAGPPRPRDLNPVAWILVACGVVTMVASALPWIRDEHGHLENGWSLLLRFGPFWDQASVGFMDSDIIVPTGPILALAGLALTADAAFCITTHRHTPLRVDAWGVAALALLVSYPVYMVDPFGDPLLGPVVALAAAFVALGSLAMGLTAIVLVRFGAWAGNPEIGVLTALALGLALAAGGVAAFTAPVNQDRAQCRLAADQAADLLDEWGRVWSDEEAWLDAPNGSARERALDRRIARRIATIEREENRTFSALDHCRQG